MLNEANVLNLIQNWVSRGLVAPEHQHFLVTDVRRLQHAPAPTPMMQVPIPTTRRINPLAVVIAVICGLLGLALLAQLAANWQEIPKLMRFFLLCGGLLAVYGGAGWRLHRVGLQDVPLHGFACLGTVMYGVSLLLISQMFHVGGTAADWLLLWLIGTYLVALVLSSRPVLLFSIFLAGIWGACLIFPQGLGEPLAPLTDHIWQYPLVLLPLFLPAYRWHCTAARALLLIVCCLWGLTVLGQVITTWDDLSKGLRLTLLLTVFLSLYGWTGWLLHKGEAAKAEVFAILGNLFYGVMLLLVGWMFRIGGTIPDWLLLWWLGVFAMTVALSSRMLLFFTLILTACLGQYLWFNHGTDPSSSGYTALFLATVVLFFVAAWPLRVRETAPAEEGLGIGFTILCGIILFLSIQLQNRFLIAAGADTVMLGWLLPWLVCGYLFALLTRSRSALVVAILCTGLWAKYRLFHGAKLLPFSDYAGQFLPVLSFLLLLVLRWKDTTGIVLWQILFFGWLDVLLWQSDFLHRTSLLIGTILLLHLSVATATRFLSDRWDWLKVATIRLNLWLVLAITFVYAIAYSLDGARMFGAMMQKAPLVLAVLLVLGAVTMAAGLFVLWRRGCLSRLAVVLHGIPLLFALLLFLTSLLPEIISAKLYEWVNALLVLSLLIVLLLGEAVKNNRSTMILCSVVLVIACIIFYWAWDFSRSASLFFVVGAGLFAGMKMVRRVRA